MYEKKECPACHCLIDEDAKVCPYCYYDFSTALVQPEKKQNNINYCPSCGIKLSDESSTCPNCGNSIHHTDESTSSEKKNTKSGYIIGLILKILLALLIVNIIVNIIYNYTSERENNEPLIRRVQQSYLEGYPETVNIETLVSSLLSSTTWHIETTTEILENLPATSNYEFPKRAIVSGTVLWFNNPATMEIGFEEDSDFNVSIYAVELNGNPLNELEIEAVIYKMYNLATAPKI